MSGQNSSGSQIQGTFERDEISGVLVDAALTTAFLSGPGSILTATYVLPGDGSFDLNNPVVPDLPNWVGITPQDVTVRFEDISNGEAGSIVFEFAPDSFEVGDSVRYILDIDGQRGPGTQFSVAMYDGRTGDGVLGGLPDPGPSTVVVDVLPENIIEGGPENDILRGTNGVDLIFGRGGSDRLFGRGDNDTLDGGKGNDKLLGGKGQDELCGGSGHDRLIGGLGTDMLHGGTGNDYLEGGGLDTLFGDEDSDTLAINVNDKKTVIGIKLFDGGEGEDTLKIVGKNEPTTGTEHILDLTLIDDDHLVDIEAIDITGKGDNVLVLDTSEVRNLSSTSNTVKVFGNGGDEVFASGGWQDAGLVTENGTTFDAYTFDDLRLLIDQSITDQNIT